MAAPKGNEFWRKRRVHGRRPRFNDPDVLWDYCCLYFEWVVANPHKVEKVFVYRGKVISGSLRKMRAMTLNGLCLFLGISEMTWSNYRKREDFFWVIERVENIICEYKFTGAAVNLLNPRIIARELGIR